MKKQTTKQEKKPKFRVQIIITLLLFLFLTGCYYFDFINQPYTADPNSFFDVEISVNTNSWGTTDSTIAYFGVSLPIGWTINDTLEYTSYVTNETGEIIYSDSLSEQMALIDPPPLNYYWWVGQQDNIVTQSEDTIILNVQIFTDSQTGTFFLDYMLGDGDIDYYGNIRGLNYKRSDNHLIIIGDPVGCLPEGISFNTQAEVDSFQFNHPGCNEIAGNVMVNGTDITNLSGLDIINSIGGNFSIINSDTLTNLTGLNNLTSVGGAFSITDNYMLTNLIGLENITSVGRDLFIENNWELTSLSSMSGLGTVGRDLEIINNYHLISLTGLEMVSSPGGSLTIQNNRNLINLSGLENITNVVGDLNVSGNRYLISIDALTNITFTGGDLIIASNRDLPSLSGLNNISFVGGTLKITGNSSLPNFSGLNNITNIGQDLEIYSNSTLTSLTGLENLDTLGRDLWIGKSFPRPSGPQGNPLLTNILALENLSFIGRDVHINYNDTLTTCDADGICNYLSAPNGVVDIYWNAPGCDNILEVAEACGITLPCLPFGPYYFYTQDDIDSFQVNFPACTQLEGNVLIYGSDITNLDGLSDVTSIGGNLQISASNLSNLNGFSLVTSIGGDLRIYGTDITNLNGLSLVTTIGGDLSISGTNITSLNALNLVTSIGGEFRIYDNDYLGSLSGLQNIEPASIDNLTIRANNSLSNCDVYSICNYLVAPNGTIYIEDNAPGCNSELEILDACENNCLPNGITFTTQEEIDNFQTNYPGCNEIGGDVEIYGNSITNLDGLNVLTTIGGKLTITNNYNLTSLNGLENLASIAGELEIIQNNNLTSLTGLDNIAAASISNLTITYNDSLSTCEVQSICDYLSSPGGTVNIYANSTGCNNPPEIASSCGIVLPCLPYGNYYFHSQTQIDDFQTNYPGCYQLNGEVFISGDEILNSNGLGVVTSVEGNLMIARNNSLLNLTGLDNVTHIGGDLTIFGNLGLNSLTGLENLTTIGGELNIGEIVFMVGCSGNPSLPDFTGLNSLSSIGSNFNIIANGSLTNFNGLESLTSIGGNLMVGIYGPPLGNYGNHILKNFSGMDSLTTIGGELFIRHNDSLSSLAGLNNINPSSISNLYIHDNISLANCEVESMCNYLASPNGTVDIYNNAPGCNSIQEVEDACGFHCPTGDIVFATQEEIDNFQLNYPYCSEIEWDVEIHGDDISNLNGLSVLVSIEGDLEIKDNNSLADLTGLDNLGHIGGNLDIYGNDLMVNLEGLASLSFVAGDLLIGHSGYENPALSSLSGLGILTSIGGDVEIKFSNSLTNLSGLDNLDHIGGNLNIYGNDILESLAGLGDLTSIDGNFLIGHYWGYGNPALTSLSGLDNLNSIGGYLWILANETLSSLTGLENLNSIDGDLIIGSESAGGNPLLTSLDALNNLDPGSMDALYVYHNNTLADCDAWSICEYISENNGYIEIHDNAPDCNSIEEVQYDCDSVFTTLQETNNFESFTISPNPLESTTLIAYTLNKKSPVFLQILDLSGREMVLLVNETQQQGEQQIIFNTSGLPAGIYFCVLKTNEKVQTKKIIKL